MIPKSIFIAALILLPFATGFSADFNRDIRPILSDKCFACHGFDEQERKADLRLDTKEGAFADLGGYAAVVPGKIEESELWLRIISDDSDEIMPPPKAHKNLTKTEIALIKEWIENGAEYKTHWSHAPLEKKEITGRSVVDHFIKKRLAAEDLTLSPRADKITLARRVYLDLLGLPPTPAEVDAFVKDTSADAFEKLVDRLLADSAFGERMAVYWLDLVRFADTIGYHSDNLMEVSAYREYVISAFNKNLPYDQFTIEQLAGDLLPNPTLDQKIASGYNRLLQTTEEGGAQAEEYKVIHAADRVRNVSAVWLASTIGCAQCHDHKYDPFSTRDFYTLAAFFADVKEKPIGKRVPNLKLPSEEEKAKIAGLKKQLGESEIDRVVERDAALKEKIRVARAEWEKKILTQLEGEKIWKPIKPNSAKSTGGQKLTIHADRAVLASGENPNKANYTVELTGSGRVTAIRLEALKHQSLAKGRLSRANGNFILSGFAASHKGKPLKIARAAADYEQPSWPIAASLDGKDNTGWAVDGHTDKVGDREAMFILDKPVDLGQSGKLTVELSHQTAHPKHNIGRFRLSLTDSPNPEIRGKADLPLKLVAALRKDPAKRSDSEKKELKNHFRTRTQLLAEALKNYNKIKAEIAATEKGIRTMLVSEPLPTPRMTRILNRGDWLDKKGEVVEPALPAFLPRDADLPKDRRGTRLDLAKWIMAESNPLTARAFVNRIWMLMFGEGISRDVEDLGGQGKPPTHPELLDQLAIYFRESGWDVKNLIKTIVMSEAYRQTSVATTELVKRDPTNLWFGRQGRWRIDAEFVRDTALSLGGLLVKKEGGKSVKPYQPAGYWQHLNFPKRKWVSGKGDELYRRGLYTFRCRTFPHPAMVSFDASSREECTPKRSRSNIPQQALTLLNDPGFVEAARKFGERIARVGGDSDSDSKIQFAWREATSRNPAAREVEVLKELYAAQLTKFSNREADAKALASIGEAPIGEDIPLPVLAAWTQVARAILNAYETTSRN